MKKYNVRVYLHTFCDFEVEAENEQDAIEIAENNDYDMEQIIYNMVQDGSSDVEEVFKVGDKVVWLDPQEEYRDTTRVYTIDAIEGEIIRISDEYSEVEVTSNELIKL